MITCLQKLLELHKLCCFQTIEGEKVGVASNSELRRWFQQKCVQLNDEFPSHDDPCPPYIARLVLFPKNPRKRTTLFWDKDWAPPTLIQVDERLLNSIMVSDDNS